MLELGGEGRDGFEAAVQVRRRGELVASATARASRPRFIPRARIRAPRWSARRAVREGGRRSRFSFDSALCAAPKWRKSIRDDEAEHESRELHRSCRRPAAGVLVDGERASARARANPRRGRGDVSVPRLQLAANGMTGRRRLRHGGFRQPLGAWRYPVAATRSSLDDAGTGLDSRGDHPPGARGFSRPPRRPLDLGRVRKTTKALPISGRRVVHRGTNTSPAQRPSTFIRIIVMSSCDRRARTPRLAQDALAQSAESGASAPDEAASASPEIASRCSSLRYAACGAHTSQTVRSMRAPSGPSNFSAPGCEGRRPCVRDQICTPFSVRDAGPGE